MTERSELQRLCGSLERGDIDVARFLGRFTRLLAEMLGCGRCGVWMFNQEANKRALECVAMFDVEAASLVKPPKIHDLDAAVFIEELERNGSVIASDVRTHPLTTVTLQSYLRETQVRALLSICFSVNGRAVIAFSGENLRQPMDWGQTQIQVMRHICSRAGLALLHAADSRVDTAPGALWDSTPPLKHVSTVSLPLDTDFSVTKPGN